MSMQQALQHPAARTRVGLITVTVMLGLIMAIIDTTIVNVAISTIGGNLGATVDEVAWIATGYILANVVVMPLNGWLTALLGRKTAMRRRSRCSRSPHCFAAPRARYGFSSSIG
jgi:MFS family permease